MPNVRRVRAIATGVAGAPFYLTQYFNEDVGSAQDCSDAVRDILGSFVGGFVSAITWRMDPVVTSIDTATGQPVSTANVTPGSPIQGVASADPLPLQVQLGVNTKTGVYSAGRQIQGHFSVPGVAESVNVNGSGPNTADTPVVSLQTALNAVVSGGDVAWVVYSRKSGSAALIANATINPRWFTLRSRLT